MIDIPDGYRELNHGEYLSEGDMFYSYRDAGWTPVSHVQNAKYRIKYNKNNRSARHVRPIIRENTTT